MLPRATIQEFVNFSLLILFGVILDVFVFLRVGVTDPKGKSMHHDDCVGPLDSWMGEDFTFH